MTLSDKIKEIGMSLAKIEQDKILARHNLLSLNAEQIDGVCSLIREVNKAHEDKRNIKIDKLAGEELTEEASGK